ncbi:hypothetical protein K469DRAFT_807199 [Zopfia rhizophila CBS 207.26]|uniref:Uncharacterized protein n=1 Tax=Zopfia rhizophila CBS 207.26 TaxID=1314779 RepID=A0A6A6DDT2_9PEZI|nr:hypothetical protein K469DRAFT_807199 [Zopfia rhizophila CBS 207.26]
MRKTREKASFMHTYHFSPRGTFAVILPSTNVALEAMYGQMLAPSVSWHCGAIYIRNPCLTAMRHSISSWSTCEKRFVTP